MRISREKLIEESKASGFRPDMLEKVIHLLNLLETINSHPFLKGKLALKGGTALNLFLFDIPRLSVDIDLNYIGSGDLENMRTERPDLERALVSVFDREDFTVKSTPGDEHAGGKWRLVYLSSAGSPGNLEVDVNYMYRIPLWPVQQLSSRTIRSSHANGIPVMDIHELAAGKIAALLARHKARDLYDCRELFASGLLDPVKLRIAFVAYGAMNPRDWRTVSIDDIQFDPIELVNELIPVLREGTAKIAGDAPDYGHKLVEDVRNALSGILPLTETEIEFLHLLLDDGKIEPPLLTSEVELQNRIMRHPALQWRALKARERH